ncbi:F-box domain-containing protein [Arthroderma uncinatum]|uniref:F-box domain-containing protein n=1 Tax=Arthroderma uncinatum TaxID=74035 RepID=UPI00144AEEF2|nr:F-box domain-containing protein [Arthroderma uncinatum]KAF3481019.1 F-box domain-containing protein [Arthroderma uncinatum]
MDRLLELPVELLQLVVKSCSTPSYLQVIRTCRTLYSIGTTCREVVRHQLSQMPGLQVTESGTPLDSQSTAALYKELRKRAAAHLYGAHFHSDVTLHTLDGRVIDTKASCLFSDPYHTPWNRPQQTLALVPRGGDSVYLYHMGESSSGNGVDAGPMVFLDKIEPLSDFPGKIEILRVISSRSHPEMISVLQRYEPPEQTTDLPSLHPFVGEAMMPYYSARIRLIHYSYASSARRWRPEAFTVFPREFEDDFLPRAIDVVDQEFVVVSWQHKESPEGSKVCLHKYNHQDVVVRKNHCSYVEYSSTELVAENKIPRRRHFSLTERPLSDPVVGRISNSTNATHTRLLDNICHAQLPEHDRTAPPIFSRFQVGIPFYGHHESKPGTGLCEWYYASVGLTRLPPNGRVGAYILQSMAQCRSDRCGHILNLDRGRRIERWVVVAKLWGFKANESNLTELITTSPGGTRLAIARWKSLYIWPLNPQEILMKNKNGYYPPDMYYSADAGINANVQKSLSVDGETGEYEMTEDGWKDVVELKPIILELDAVCFGLKFTGGENELTLLTDRGLMVWTLNSDGTARRTNGVIKPEEDAAAAAEFRRSLPEPDSDESNSDEDAAEDESGGDDDDDDDDDDEDGEGMDLD